MFAVMKKWVGGYRIKPYIRPPPKCKKYHHRPKILSLGEKIKIKTLCLKCLSSSYEGEFGGGVFS